MRGIIKAHNKYDDSNAKALENNETKKLTLIYGCTFEREKVTDSLIDYNNEEDGSRIEIYECSFKGRPEKGIKYINGKSLRKEKVQIKACKFEYNDNYERINNNLSKTEKSVSHFNSLLFLIAIASLPSLILIISIRCKSDDLYDNGENKPLDNNEL